MEPVPEMQTTPGPPEKAASSAMTAVGNHLNGRVGKKFGEEIGDLGGDLG